MTDPAVVTSKPETPSGELSEFVSKQESIPSLVMERLRDIRSLSTKVQNLKLFDSECPVEELGSHPMDPPLIQVLRQLAITFHTTRSESVKREILTEVRETLDTQMKREMEAMKECNRLMIEYAKLARKKGGNSMEDMFLATLKENA